MLMSSSPMVELTLPRTPTSSSTTEPSSSTPISLLLSTLTLCFEGTHGRNDGYTVNANVVGTHKNGREHGHSYRIADFGDVSVPKSYNLRAEVASCNDFGFCFRSTPSSNPSPIMPLSSHPLQAPLQGQGPGNTWQHLIL
ncbi:hypothetical protein VNO78_31283 [Psophocarpus tetragonolobus]|uniref:Uncharacterized protein n=1 Tax=Psophocarpus tetragonolobus TaxID=3891 RepID=A0AAN9X7C5_PSOTE